jgi:hypothetical protein
MVAIEHEIEANPNKWKEKVQREKHFQPTEMIKDIYHCPLDVRFTEVFENYCSIAII